MDINTIFYFPSSLTFEEYSNKLDQGEISERTIVFADAQKAIYKGGKKYGGTSVQEFHNLIDTLYDDSWISDEITNIKADIIQAIARMNQFNTLVTNIGNTLDLEIEDRDTNIQTKIEQLMQDAQWILENFPQGVTQWDARWNEDIEAYLQTVGYWTIENGQVITKWSQIEQSVDSIRSSVNNLTQDGLLSTALTSSIQLLIRNNIATLELDTTYAKSETVDGVTHILEWMYSGLKSSASPDKTFTELSSMGKSGLLSAISHIRTQVERLDDGAFLSTADIEAISGNVASGLLLLSTGNEGLAALYTKVNDNSDDIASIVLGITGSLATADISTLISNYMSGFASGASVDGAFSEIYSAIKDANGNFISSAQLKTDVDINTSNIRAISSTVTTLSNNQSGFVTTSGLDSAVAKLFSSSTSTSDAVGSKISTATSSFITSSQADTKIATAKAEAIATASSNTTTAISGLASTSYVDTKVSTASSTLLSSIDDVSSSLSLTVKKDSSGNIESTAKLSADLIYLSGTTWADVINASSIVSDIITAGTATFTGTVNATSGNFSGDITIRKTNSSPDGLRFDSDGNIQRWDGSAWVGLYASSHVKYITSNYTVAASDDIIICGLNNAQITLPSSPTDGRQITIRNVGTSEKCLIRSSHVMSVGGTDTPHGSDNGVYWILLNNDDRADFIYYGGTWYWNCYGT